MYENDVEQLNKISQSIRRLNGKIKLLALLERAKKFYDESQYADCENACKEVLKKEPNNPSALRGLGCVQQMLGNYKRAIEFFQKALEKSEQKEVEYTLIGMVYYLQDMLDEAIENFNKAIDINDDYDSAYEGRNQAMLERHVQILDLQDSLIKQHLWG